MRAIGQKTWPVFGLKPYEPGKGQNRYHSRKFDIVFNELFTLFIYLFYPLVYLYLNSTVLFYC